jgi:hypothetical protein
LMAKKLFGFVWALAKVTKTNNTKNLNIFLNRQFKTENRNYFWKSNEFPFILNHIAHFLFTSGFVMSESYRTSHKLSR